MSLTSNEVVCGTLIKNISLQVNHFSKNIQRLAKGEKLKTKQKKLLLDSQTTFPLLNLSNTLTPSPQSKGRPPKSRQLPYWADT